MSMTITAVKPVHILHNTAPAVYVNLAAPSTYQQVRVRTKRTVQANARTT